MHYSGPMQIKAETPHCKRVPACKHFSPGEFKITSPPQWKALCLMVSKDILQWTVGSSPSVLRKVQYS